MTNKTITIKNDLPLHIKALEVSDDLTTVKVFDEENEIMTISFDSSIKISKGCYDLNKVERDEDGEPLNPDDYISCLIDTFINIDFDHNSRFTNSTINQDNFDMFLEYKHSSVDADDEDEYNEFIDELVKDISLRLSFDCNDLCGDELRDFVEDKMIENSNKNDSLALSIGGFNTLNYDDWIKKIDVSFNFSEDDIEIGENIDECDNISNDWEHDFIIL